MPEVVVTGLMLVTAVGGLMGAGLLWALSHNARARRARGGLPDGARIHALRAEIEQLDALALPGSRGSHPWSLFLRTCAALGRGDLARASREVEALRSRSRDPACVVLEGILRHRTGSAGSSPFRSQPSTAMPWLESVLAAWKAAGSPKLQRSRLLHPTPGIRSSPPDSAPPKEETIATLPALEARLERLARACRSPEPSADHAALLHGAATETASPAEVLLALLACRDLLDRSVWDAHFASGFPDGTDFAELYARIGRHALRHFPAALWVRVLALRPYRFEVSRQRQRTGRELLQVFSKLPVDATAEGPEHAVFGALKVARARTDPAAASLLAARACRWLQPGTHGWGIVDRLWDIERDPNLWSEAHNAAHRLYDLLERGPRLVDLQVAANLGWTLRRADRSVPGYDVLQERIERLHPIRYGLLVDFMAFPIAPLIAELAERSVMDEVAMLEAIHQASEP